MWKVVTTNQPNPIRAPQFLTQGTCPTHAALEEDRKQLERLNPIYVKFSINFSYAGS